MFKIAFEITFGIGIALLSLLFVVFWMKELADWIEWKSEFIRRKKMKDAGLQRDYD